MNQIQFFLIPSPIFLKPFLQERLFIDSDRADFLIYFGAIYKNGIRLTDNVELKRDDLLRCHLNPKRFFSTPSWNQYLVFENEEFVVLDKPPGLPCQPSLDNRIENVLFLLSKELKQNLFITNRLDVGTEGLLVIGKNKNFQTYYNQLLEARMVTKIYECLTSGPKLSLERLTHWMQPSPFAPKVLSPNFGEQEQQGRWKICELEILDSSIESTLNANYYRLQLHTGRTHQIRAQLSFEKNPIFGDALYGGLKLPDNFKFNTDSKNSGVSFSYEHHALRCSELSFKFKSETFHWNLSRLISEFIRLI